jgi:hypothetical protein
MASEQDFTFGVDYCRSSIMEPSTDTKDVLQFHL